MKVKIKCRISVWSKAFSDLKVEIEKFPDQHCMELIQVKLVPSEVCNNDVAVSRSRALNY